MYHSSRVARDRDRLRQQVLDGLGWTLHRIWGPSWYRDRPGEERRLQEAIERALLFDNKPAATPRPPKPVAVDFEDVVLDAPPPWAEPYVAATLPPARAADISHARAASEIRQLVMTTVTEEAPIVEDLLIRRVIGVWGDVLSEKRRSIIRRHIESLASSGALVRSGNAYLLPNQSTDLVRVPTARIRARSARSSTCRTSSSPRRWRGWSATRGSSPRRKPSSAPRGSSAGRATARPSRRRWRAWSRTSRTTGASSATPTVTCTRSV